MPLSNSFVRRYTPPTCSLEVVAESSPLSRWMGRTVLKQLRFVLSFDDPRQPEEDRMTIRGDRYQLEALHTAVTNYVQELLQQSPDRFHAAYFSNSNQESEKEETSSHSTPQTIALNPNPHLGNGVHLQPSNNGLNHNLYLGSLFTEASASVIPLSVLQLFDLATALDEYTADAVALPTQKRRKFAVPAWAPVAAVAAVAVALIPLTMQLVPKRTQQIASTDTAAQPPQAQLPLSATPATGITPLAVPDKLPAVPPPLSSLPQVPTAAFPTAGTLTVPATKTGIPSAQNVPGSIANPTTITPPEKKSTTRTKTSTVKPPSTITTNPFAAASLPSRSEIVSSPLGARKPVTPNSTRRGASSVQPSLATSTVPDTTTTAGQLVDRLGGSPRTPEASNDATAFDTTPQVAEARAYLKRRWKAPSGLKDSLQYSVTVDVDGTVQRILPLGNLASTYVDKSGMPEIGSHFVSANKNGQTSEIRVLLSPDGTVKTFAVSP
ncbi:MAG: DUF4335 domain-containing protein [Nostocaceae cyanobacterium]|nr:DUF4335 domain-containing protein [Nostocaceae cyanobacterium]